MPNLDWDNYRYKVLPFFEANTIFPYRDGNGFVTIGVGVKPDIEFAQDYTGSDETLKALNGVLKSGTVYIQEDIKDAVQEHAKKEYPNLFPPYNKETHKYGEITYGVSTSQTTYKVGSPFYDYLLARGAILHFKAMDHDRTPYPYDKGLPFSDALDTKTKKPTQGLDSLKEKKGFLLERNYTYFFRGDTDTYSYDDKVSFKIIGKDGEGKKLEIHRDSELIGELPLLESLRIKGMGLSEEQLIGLTDLAYQGNFSKDSGVWGNHSRRPVYELKAIVFLFLYINYATQSKQHSIIKEKLFNGETLEDLIKALIFETKIAKHFPILKDKKKWYDTVHSIAKSFKGYLNIGDNQPAQNELGHEALRSIFRLHAIFCVPYTLDLGQANIVQIRGGK